MKEKYDVDAEELNFKPGRKFPCVVASNTLYSEFFGPYVI